MSDSLVTTVGAEPPPGWQDLVLAQGGIYHDLRWIQLIGTYFRFPVAYLSVADSVGLASVLALAEVPSLGWGRRLVSFPFSYAAGPASRVETATRAIMEAAATLGRERRARRVEVKHWTGPATAYAGFNRVRHYAAYRVATTDGVEALWQRLHADSTRRSIRRAERAGVTVVRGETGGEWEVMARLQDATAHSHGIPSPPHGFFLEACRSLQTQGLADLWLARVPAIGLAAGIVVWKGRREWVYAFGASRPDTLEFRPNHALLWHALREAAGGGVLFDLGRAAPEQEGLVQFKLRWGAEPVALSYDYWPDAGGLNALHRARGPLALAGRLWRRLPAPVARLGSRLYRYLG